MFRARADGDFKFKKVRLPPGINTSTKWVRAQVLLRLPVAARACPAVTRVPRFLPISALVGGMEHIMSAKFDPGTAVVSS